MPQSAARPPPASIRTGQSDCQRAGPVVLPESSAPCPRTITTSATSMPPRIYGARRRKRCAENREARARSGSRAVPARAPTSPRSDRPASTSCRAESARWQASERSLAHPESALRCTRASPGGSARGQRWDRPIWPGGAEDEGPLLDMSIIGRLRHPEDGIGACWQSPKRDGHLLRVRRTDPRVPLVYLLTRWLVGSFLTNRYKSIHQLVCGAG